jgi:hypothetical protein
LSARTSGLLWDESRSNSKGGYENSGELHGDSSKEIDLTRWNKRLSVDLAALFHVRDEVDGVSFLLFSYSQAKKIPGSFSTSAMRTNFIDEPANDRTQNRSVSLNCLSMEGLTSQV